MRISSVADNPAQLANLTRMPRNAMRFGLVLLVVAALYWPDTATLVRYWLHQDINAQSGILIAFLSLFLLFRSRDRLERVPTRPVPWASLPLMACAAASMICWRAGIQTLQLLFLPAILWLAVLSVLGVQTARAAGFAVGFLYFALPGWDLFQSPLQHLTAWAAGAIGPVLGLPVAMHGTTAYLPAGVTFTIETACSGVDFLTVGLAVATLHGELERATFRRRAGLIGGMTLVAIVSNWLRVILILAIGYLSSMRSVLATTDHVAFGWGVFACAMLLFVWIAGRTGRKSPDAAVAEDSGAQRDAVSHRTYSRPAVWRYGVAVAGLLFVPAFVYANLLASDQSQASASALEFPPGRAPWQGPADSPDALWQPRFAGAQIERRARYLSADGRSVEVVAFGFPKQTQGVKVLKEHNTLLGDRGLAIEAVTLVESAAIPHGEVVVLAPDGGRSLIWSVVDIGGRLFGEPLYSQLWYGARSLLGTPYSALFALRAQCGGSCDAARAVLADFLRVNGPALFASLPDSDLKG